MELVGYVIFHTTCISQKALLTVCVQVTVRTSTRSSGSILQNKLFDQGLTVLQRRKADSTCEGLDEREGEDGGGG